MALDTLYYYRVYVVNAYGTFSPDSPTESSARTLNNPLPFSDGFEGALTSWNLAGTWGRQTNDVDSGLACLSDSPGFTYTNNSDSFAQTAVDLSGSSWPVLRFWHKFRMADNDWARVEVSTDRSSWTPVYGAAGVQSEWREQCIDLSAWKNSGQVWVRFQMDTDGGTQNDGWYLDDVSVEDYILPPAVYPVFKNFEAGLDNWLHSSWVVNTNMPYAGLYAARDTVPPRIPPDAQLSLVFAREINLSNAINPSLTFWVRGQLWYRTRFRAQASPNWGVNWNDLVALNYDWNQNWTRLQVPLTSYTNCTIRFRFIVWSEWGSAPDQDLFLDNIGIGEPAPGAPTLAAPANFTVVGVSRPTLVVSNAVDYQRDPLTYRFEVYADPALSDLVAQVSAVASGSETTAWTVDTDLPNNAQFWWRCRATDGTNVGPWMATATFYVKETNRPPAAPVIAGPPVGLVLTNLDVLLLWSESAGDPDEGDRVMSYHLQVTDNLAFALPVINVTSIPAIEVPPGSNWVLSLPLNSLPGAQNLVWRTLYYRRISAQDQRGRSSAWSAPWPLQYGPPAPKPGTITGIRREPDGRLTIEWTGASGLVYIEYSHTLDPADWYTIAGPLQGTNWTLTPIPGTTSGFYRIRSE